MDENTNLQCHPELVEGIKKDIFRYFLCQYRRAQCDKAVVSYLYNIDKKRAFNIKSSY
jgi:hypothetical protein